MNYYKLINLLLDRYKNPPPKLLAVGPPRSGFTLLISILTQLLYKKSYKFRKVPFRDELSTFIPAASKNIYKEIEQYFSKHINIKNLVIAPGFQLLVGGPKWLSKENSEMAKVRKYIGIKGLGDFLAVFSIPKYAMDYYHVIHSHNYPELWLEDKYYDDHIKFASIRNPLDIINSSVFSLNALTGDYIDNHLHGDGNAIREKLGLYKLTDLNFLEGLINPLLDYLKSFVQIRDRFWEMKWENLITEGGKTIFSIAEFSGLQVKKAVAEKMWNKMKFKDQTADHRHNFRKGVIDDWQNYLINEHLEIIRGYGIEDYMEILGYGRLQFQNRKGYTPFQKKVERYIKTGKIYNEIEDQDLFMFAFNKSNFRSSKYDFISYTNGGSVEIERSSIKDKILLMGFLEAVEKNLNPINETIKAIYQKYSG